jgi:hypothetical protein
MPEKLLDDRFRQSADEKEHCFGRILGTEKQIQLPQERYACIINHAFTP